MKYKKPSEADLNEDEFIFDVENDEIEDVADLINTGKHPVCSICGVRMQCAITPEAARASEHPPGLYCLTSPGHCQISINFARNR